MAEYLPVRALTRSQKVRIGTVLLTPDVTTFVNLSDGKAKRDLQRHSAIGSYIVVGPVAGVNDGITLATGAVVSQGANATDLIIAISAGTFSNAQAIAANATLTIGAAPAAGLTRIDLIQTATATGVSTVKAGTAAVVPSPPAPDAGNYIVAYVRVPSGTTAITDALITNVR